MSYLHTNSKRTNGNPDPRHQTEITQEPKTRTLSRRKIRRVSTLRVRRKWWLIVGTFKQGSA